MITPSWIFTLSPIVILLTSPLTTALNQTLHLSPIFTLPTIVALGAIKQFCPNCGNFPSTGSIVAISGVFDFEEMIDSLIYELCTSMHTQNHRLFLQHVAQTSPAPLAIEIERAEGLY